MLFNSFIIDVDSGEEPTVSKFVIGDGKPALEKINFWSKDSDTKTSQGSFQPQQLCDSLMTHIFKFFLAKSVVPLSHTKYKKKNLYVA